MPDSENTQYLTDDTTNDIWSGTFQLTKQNNTKITLATNDKYIDKNIELTVNAQAATPSFTGGAITGSTSASSTTATIDNSINNSGVTFSITGTAARDAIQYATAVNGWVYKAADAEAYSASTSTSITGATYYINGVQITAAASSATDKTFIITVPNGSGSTIDFVFHVDNNGNVTVQEV